MSIELLERAAAVLDDLLAEVVFLGGAAIELWITDPGAPPVRPTVDVDVVVESVEATTEVELQCIHGVIPSGFESCRSFRTSPIRGT